MAIGWTGRVLAGFLVATTLVGCATEAPVVTIEYFHPAAAGLEDDVTVLAVCSFVGDGPQDRPYAAQAGQRLADVLRQADPQTAKFTVEGPIGTDAVTASAWDQYAQSSYRTGRQAGAQAVAFGRVHVEVTDRAGQAPADESAGSSGPIDTLHRSAAVSVTFYLSDPFTARQIVSQVFTRTYDSKDISGSHIPPREQIVGALLDECVEAFAHEIAPFRQRVEMRLAGGKGQIAKGNRLAADGQYAQALESFVANLEAEPDNADAAFNAGVMCEKLGDLAGAEKYYSQALKNRYSLIGGQSLARVRNELRPND